jgi:integron integrase
MHSTEKVEKFTPAEQAIMAEVAAMVRVKHQSYRTGVSYGVCVVEYRRWLAKQPQLRSTPSEEKLRAYLSACAPSISAKTQNQRLCAILRYYAEVRKTPLGDLGKFAYAKVPQRLPTWLSKEEVRRLLSQMTGTPALMACLTYGAGLRLLEITRLRVQDIDLDQKLVFVRDSKGQKDRIVPLPAALQTPVLAHLERIKGLWASDRVRRTNPVQTPESVQRKCPNAGHELGWFWVFPGMNISRDPETGVVRRHHVTRNCLQKAVKTAAVRAAIHKRVCVHTLRHSFATHHLERGTHVEQLRQLLGHESIETTSIYVHCLPKAVHAAGSPLDDFQGALTAPSQDFRCSSAKGLL